MSKPIRIGIDIRDLRIAKTGVKTYLEELIKQFELIQGNEFRFFYFDTTFSVYTGRNKFLKAIEHLRFIIWKQIHLPLKAWFKGCDLLFCADFFVPYVHLGFKTVPVLHDAFFFEYPQHYNKLWLLLFKTMGMSSAKRAAVIITPTRYTQERIAHYTGIPAEKILPVYEGPKTLRNIKEDKNISATLPHLEPKKYLLHVGTMEKRKNIINLLKAYLPVQQSYPDIKLVLIGQFSPKTDMDDRQAIQSFIKAHQLESHVIFPGYVPDKLLGAYYRHALLYVFPSINEGFGIPILEAFDHDLPVLTADNTCLPEVGGDAVLTFNPYKPADIYAKIKAVIDSPQTRAALILKGRERLKLFSWQKTAQDMLKVFKTIKQ